MEPEKDKWINDILNSLDGAERAEPSPFLYAKIRNRLTASTPLVYVPTQKVWLMVASFALLVLLNWRVTSQLSGAKNTDARQLKTVITDMQLYPDSNQPYDVWSGLNY